MKTWDWRHASGLGCLLGAVAIALYEQFGGKVTLVHDMAVIRDFCFTYAGIMFGNVMKEGQDADAKRMATSTQSGTASGAGSTGS